MCLEVLTWESSFADFLKREIIKGLRELRRLEWEKAYLPSASELMRAFLTRCVTQQHQDVIDDYANTREIYSIELFESKSVGHASLKNGKSN